MPDTATTTATPPSTTPTTGDVQLESFLRLEPKIRAIPEDELIPINIDGTLAVTIALGAARRLPALRETMLKLGDVIDLPLIDDVAALGYAYACANADYVRATDPVETLADLHGEGNKLRDLLLASKSVIEMHGLVQGNYLEPLRGAVGYRNLSHDLSALVRFFRDNWAAIEGRTPLGRIHIDRASVLAGKLLEGVGVKQGTAAEIDASTLVRAQAFTLFVKAYDEVRRVVTFLRWKEEDIDAIAPSIYSGRNNGGRKRAEPESADTTSPLAAPNASSNMPPAPATSQPVPDGHPGARPFTG